MTIPLCSSCCFSVTAGTPFPRQVLSVEPTGFVYFGTDIGFNQNLSVEAVGPIVVDTVDRLAYWFDDTVNLIYTQPLNSGGVVTVCTYFIDRDKLSHRFIFQYISPLSPPSRPFKNMQPFLMMPSATTLVALAYDWIGKLIYVSRVNTATRKLELIRVNIFEADRQENVFPSLQDTIPVNATVKSVMSPFTG